MLMTKKYSFLLHPILTPFSFINNKFVQNFLAKKNEFFNLIISMVVVMNKINNDGMGTK